MALPGLITKMYAEAGIGNDTFFSTEYENGDREYRISKFIRPAKVEGYYIRVWIFKTVYIFATNEGLKITHKTKNKFKILFGMSGREK